MRTARALFLVVVAVAYFYPQLARAQNPVRRSDCFFFIGTDQHVYLSWAQQVNGRFGENFSIPVDATSLSGAPLAASNGTLASYGLGTAVYVFYIGTDHSIYEIYYDTSAGWHFLSPTAVAGAPPAADGSALAAPLDGSYGYIYYFSADMHVQQLTYNTLNQWFKLDLTVNASAPLAANVSSLTAFFFGSYTYVDYLNGGAPTNDIIELYTVNAHITWHYTDISAQAQVGPAAPGSALVGGRYPGQNAHVFYITANGSTYSINELYTSNYIWYPGNIAQELYLSGGASSPANLQSLAYVPFYEPNGYLWVFYTSQAWGSTNAACSLGILGGPGLIYGYTTHFAGTGWTLFPSVDLRQSHNDCSLGVVNGGPLTTDINTSVANGAHFYGVWGGPGSGFVQYSPVYEDAASQYIWTESTSFGGSLANPYLPGTGLASSYWP